jgi:hypothetical protein
MDFMFEDEVDEVGSDVEAYCPKCKADTTHVVISKYEEEIRRVQCNPCGDVHSFRKPRGETEDDVPEPVAARKRAMLKKPGWDEFFARRSPNDAKPYEFREAYRENIIVHHPKFGVGFVSEVVSDSKVEITFQDARRILVHNRRDIPGLPLAAEGDGVPTPGKGVRDAAKEAAREAAKEAAREATREAREAAREAVREAAAREGAKEAKAAAREARAAAKEAAKAAGGKEAPKPAPVPVAKPAPPPVKPPVKEAPKPVATHRPEAKGKPPRPIAKAAKTAAPRGGKATGKTAAKSAAKKPAPKAKKKAGKKH